jgi:hypothetical protein
VIAVIALLAALGGTVYAANKIKGSQIAKNSIPGNRLKSKSISGSRLKPDTLTGKQIKEKSLKQVPDAAHADNATHATSADNATTVNGHAAACGTGTIPFAGACWETAARTATTWAPAAAVCTSAGGSLPDAADLQSFAQNSGVTLANTDEWASDIDHVAALNTFTVATVSKTGSINNDASTDTKQYRCVIPLVH